MKLIEALELLKMGSKVGEFNGNVIYQMFRDGKIGYLHQDTACAARIVSYLSEEEFLSLGNHKFELL